MKKILLILVGMMFLLSSCFIGRQKKERYYMLHPGKAKLKGMYECSSYPKRYSKPYKGYRRR
jgi:hypothetical protein